MDKPTLTAGHTVDLLITRDEHLAVNISVCVPALSDHFVVHCNITPRCSRHFSITWFGFLYVQSLLGIARQWSREKFAILTLKPRSRVRILIYRAWAIGYDDSREGGVVPYMGGIDGYVPLRRVWFSSSFVWELTLEN